MTIEGSLQLMAGVCLLLLLQMFSTFDSVVMICYVNTKWLIPHHAQRECSAAWDKAEAL